MLVTHTQPFNSPLSGTTWVSRYQKKHSSTHTHEEDKKDSSQRWLLDPIKPDCKQSQPDGGLKLIPSTFNRLWISMPAVLVAVPTVTQKS